MVAAHVDTLVGQLTGSSRTASPGEFAAADPAANPPAAARAVFDTTARFHDPVYAADWRQDGIQAEYEAARALVLRGLGTAR